jgi:hypothetical protein
MNGVSCQTSYTCNDIMLNKYIFGVLFVCLPFVICTLHYLQGELNLTFSQCSRFAVNWTALLEMNQLVEITPNDSWPVEPCQEGWEYDTTQVTSSIVIDVSTQEYGSVTECEVCATWLLLFILPVTVFFCLLSNSVILTSGVI